jgi:hypothetical protein
MYQDNHGQGNSSEELSLKTSLFGYSSVSSVSGSQACHPNQETDQQNTELQDDSSFCTGNADTEIPFVDGCNLNRDAMPPWTIVVTRAQHHGQGEVPIVESTDLGPVAFCQIGIEEGVFYAFVSLATNESARDNNPKWSRTIRPEVKRLEVGTVGCIPLIDHDFDRGDEIKVDGESIDELIISGGYIDFDYLCVPPELRTEPRLSISGNFKGGARREIGYIKLEIKPSVCHSPDLTPHVTNRSLENSRYFRVFQKAGHHYDD